MTGTNWIFSLLALSGNYLCFLLSNRPEVSLKLGLTASEFFHLGNA